MTTGAKIALAALAAALCVKISWGGNEYRLISLTSSAPKREIPREIAEAEFLWAIAERETGNDPRAIGRVYGERSKYQFTRDTWAMHTKRPFVDATSDPKCADTVAMMHYTWLVQRLGVLHIRVSVRTMAAAWHFGQQFAKICQESEYARAVENLYDDEVRK